MEGVLVNILGTLALLGISVAAYRLGATDVWGSVSGFSLGLLIAATSGWAWVSVLIAFLVLGSGATRYRYQFKLSIHAAEEKRGARGIRNVVANGAVAASISIINHFEPSPVFTVLFVAAIASAAADTLATEIGLLSDKRPILINRPSSVTPPGISGGVTLLGEMAALLGSLIMALFAAALGVLASPLAYILIAALAGFVGCNVDSLLGSASPGPLHVRLVRHDDREEGSLWSADEVGQGMEGRRQQRSQPHLRRRGRGVRSLSILRLGSTRSCPGFARMVEASPSRPPCP